MSLGGVGSSVSDAMVVHEKISVKKVKFISFFKLGLL
ncbi:hypothetical protein BCO_0900136 (plasmid) [Borrelia coriaceae ATCC 43381]|uniref:Uncharacterized protein n=1 Tax=Borrelia coriaceae ATCC 43381 TaxID=1408429 RepID=W5SX40_9SPIR|nr:hypothetical protein BCO_0900136 [Borrelia coriaceae ATCC 43381]